MLQGFIIDHDKLYQLKENVYQFLFLFGAFVIFAFFGILIYTAIVICIFLITMLAMDSRGPIIFLPKSSRYMIPQIYHESYDPLSFVTLVSNILFIGMIIWQRVEKQKMSYFGFLIIPISLCSKLAFDFYYFDSFVENIQYILHCKLIINYFNLLLLSVSSIIVLKEYMLEGCQLIRFHYLHSGPVFVYTLLMLYDKSTFGLGYLLINIICASLHGYFNHLIKEHHVFNEMKAQFANTYHRMWRIYIIVERTMTLVFFQNWLMLIVILVLSSFFLGGFACIAYIIKSPRVPYM